MTTELLTIQRLLATAMQADPLLSLVNSVVWLDPLWQDDEDEWDMPHDEDGMLAVALRITRTAFPGLYVEAVQAIRHGASYNEIDYLICNTITAYGIPLESLEWIGFGVPMPAHGILLEDPETYSTHPEIVSVLACFGISPDPNPYNIDVPDCAYTAAHQIANDLQDRTDERYRQVSWLLQWIFSCSGNSSVDLSYEELCEFQPLSWEDDELAFALEIIEEADQIMSDAMAGLTFINEQPDLMAALQNNIRRIYKATQKKGKNNEPRIRLAWPHLAGGTERAAESVA